LTLELLVKNRFEVGGRNGLLELIEVDVVVDDDAALAECLDLQPVEGVTDQGVAINFSELNFREKKAWRVLDQYMVLERKDGKKIPAAVALEAACFILKRLYPEKMKLEGENIASQFHVTVKVDDGNNTTQETSNRISEFIKV
jgi:hypothetical protein